MIWHWISYTQYPEQKFVVLNQREFQLPSDELERVVLSLSRILKCARLEPEETSYMNINSRSWNSDAKEMKAPQRHGWLKLAFLMPRLRSEEIRNERKHSYETVSLLEKEFFTVTPGSMCNEFQTKNTEMEVHTDMYVTTEQFKTAVSICDTANFPRYGFLTKCNQSLLVGEILLISQVSLGKYLLKLITSILSGWCLNTYKAWNENLGMS